VRACPCNTATLKIDTAVVKALLAIKAGPTVERGLDHHLLADLPVRDPRPHRRNRTAELVAHDKAGWPRMGSIAKAVHITSTNARALHLDEPAARLRYRLRHGRHPHVMRSVKHSGLHGSLLSSRTRSVLARPEGTVSCPLSPGGVTAPPQRLAPVLACIPHVAEERKDRMPGGRQADERTMMLFSLGVKAESPVETPLFSVNTFSFFWFFQ